jgi:hypothetical protein
MLIRSWLYIFGLFFPLLTFSAEKWDYFLTEGCKITPSSTTKFEPYEFHSSNNLVREVGGNLYATGKVFVLTGKLLDSSCLPISDAKINIWHADSNGFLPNPDKEENHKLQKFFQLSGTAYTNNLGIFNFITLMPNYFHKKNGEIYLKAIIEGAGEFYHTITINETMLEAYDLQDLHPIYYDSHATNMSKQYKLLWTLDVSNTYLRY